MTNIPPTSVPMTSCSAGCGRGVPTQRLDEGITAGWEHLPIGNRWRCNYCKRELDAAQHTPGTAADYAPDPLPKDSIGALKDIRKKGRK